jgi:chorismate synthase
VGCVIDGCPAGLVIEEDFLQHEMARRRPGQSALVTQRREVDRVQILSGVFESRTTGTPITLLINNEDQRSQDYAHLAQAFRPSHADYTYQAKYGHRDYRGGGRSSARETAARVAAGAIAKLLLRHFGIGIYAYVSQVGPIVLETPYTAVDLGQIETNEVRCPDTAVAQQMEALIRRVRKAGDTVGGVITGLIRGCPPGLGEPVFDKLHADLAKAMLSINPAKGFITQTNYSGGIQGGISNGMDIYFRVAFKPVATLLREQPSVDQAGNPMALPGKGRHDPCVVPRAVPIVEAMAALVLADHYLRAQSARIK